MKQAFRRINAVGPCSESGLALLLSLLLAFSGCKTEPPVQAGPRTSRFEAGELSTFHVRRVVMLPVENTTSFENVGPEFSMLLAAELRTKGAFDLVTVSHADVVDDAQQLARDGLFDDQLLALVGRKYQADAVVVGRITHFHPYWPPSMSVSLHCVDTREGRVLASVDGNWDARNSFVAHQAERFYGLLHPHESLPHSELVLHSPNYFQKFVAYQIAERFLSPSPWTQDPDFAVNE